MPRPKKTRKVQRHPKFAFFKPAGIPVRELENSTLTVGEYEALRLADLEGRQQKDVADQMEVSQPTLNRLLSSARKKVADAIVNGKAILIEGGDFEIAGERVFVCECGNEWTEAFGTGRPKACPECGSLGFRRKKETVI